MQDAAFSTLLVSNSNINLNVQDQQKNICVQINIPDGPKNGTIFVLLNFTNY